MIKKKILILLLLFTIITLQFSCNNSIADSKWKVHKSIQQLWGFGQTLNYNLKTKAKLKLTITAYSPSKYECWGNPFITASGDSVEHGVIAVTRDLAYGSDYTFNSERNTIIYGTNPLLPFGTKVLINGHGEQIFTVKDVMNERYDGEKRCDIFMESRTNAKIYGLRKDVEITILED